MMIRMETSPKVFVVILNKDGRGCLPDCLRGVFNLTYPNFEVVVVDNASRDGSIEAVKSLFGRVHYILNEKNLGFAAGMNVGIRYALSRGARYVWILNDDAIVSRDALSALVAVATSSAAPVFLSPLIRTPSGKVWFAGGRIDWLRMRAVHTGHPSGIREKAPYVTGYLSGCALFLSRDGIGRTGLFDEGYFLYYEDADLSVRAKKAGVDLLVVPEAVVAHAERSTGNSEKPYWLVRSGLRFFRFHLPFMLRPWGAVFLCLRKMKNRIDVRAGLKEAERVARAYADADKDT